MEKTENEVSLYQSSLGEAAVDGLFGGVIAGLAMAVILLVAGLLEGWDSLGSLSVISVGMIPEPTLGLFSHLAVSGVYGVTFGLVVNVVPWKWFKNMPPWSSALFGLIYGMILWSLAVVLLLPGSASPMLSISASILLIAHLVYGLFLGFYMSFKVYGRR